jgi:GxxExxY protein
MATQSGCRVNLLGGRKRNVGSVDPVKKMPGFASRGPDFRGIRPGRLLDLLSSVIEDLPYWEITDKIIAAFYEVYNKLGSGFLESVYRAALIIVMTRMGLRVETRAVLPVWFESHLIGEFRPDLIVNGCVVVEIKVARAIDPVHSAQVLNYLRASDVEVGLLLNFGGTAQFKRLYYDNERKARRDPPQELPAEHG